ncbi:MAG TPA: DNA polymerase Y family protein, partial [Albitalea sp.]|nr:DNA polymerase Y family protein [Albitalea sp.]
LKRATALALAPQITLGQADIARDTQAITSVAHAALSFTPAVTLEPGDAADCAPHTVLLEVQASLRYFGGRIPLLRRLRAALVPLRHAVQCASAPTAQGAALLARTPQVSEGRHAADLSALTRQLAHAPVWLLGAGRAHWEALQGMGLRSLSELQRLPRAGLTRRFGAALLDELDRALGAQPDPRPWVTLPQAFSSRLELFARADTTEQVLHGASLLLARLVAWASAQHAQVRRFTLQMEHEARHRVDAQTPPDSTLEIALAEPSCDAAHLLVLLRERLAHVQLAAPTLELQLHCSDVAQRAAPNSELFPTARSEREGITRLIERLQARLGGEQVQRLRCVEDHRPERASELRPATAALEGETRQPSPMPSAQRPVWLLPQAQPLPERQSRPLLDGRPLQLLCGPERIEAGWWDAALAERDYFIAQAGDGALVWIYRARLPLSASAPGWFLQGRFG